MHESGEKNGEKKDLKGGLEGSDVNERKEERMKDGQRKEGKMTGGERSEWLCVAGLCNNLVISS